MNKPLHSPAPWTVTLSDDCRVDDRITASNGAGVVSGSIHNRCDAALIADAPELLAALQWALEQIEDSLDPDHAEAFEAAQALVARHA